MRQERAHDRQKSNRVALVPIPHKIRNRELAKLRKNAATPRATRSPRSIPLDTEPPYPAKAMIPAMEMKEARLIQSAAVAMPLARGDPFPRHIKFTSTGGTESTTRWRCANQSVRQRWRSTPARSLVVLLTRRHGRALASSWRTPK